MNHNQQLCGDVTRPHRWCCGWQMVVPGPFTSHHIRCFSRLTAGASPGWRHTCHPYLKISIVQWIYNSLSL